MEGSAGSQLRLRVSNVVVPPPLLAINSAQ